MQTVSPADVTVIPLASELGEQALKLRKQYWVDEYQWKKGDGTIYESDEFDSYSGHFAFVEQGKLAGYCRFIPNHGTLPLVSVFPAIQPRLDALGPACGEYSRLLICPEYRGKDLSMLFYRAVFGWSHRRGLDWWLFEVEQWMIDVFRELHFQMEILGDGVFYRGVNGHSDQITFPVLLDIEASLRELSSVNPELWTFFISSLESRPA